MSALVLSVVVLTADMSLGEEPSYTSHHAANSRMRSAVIRYAQGKLGKQDGNGECWTLVDNALRAAGADTSRDSKYDFGNRVSLRALRRGDLLQFEGVTFEHHNANGSWYSNSYPHHSAIVESIKGRTITILNQNVNGNRTVQRSTINLDDQKGGTITAFEPKLK